jgi:hypothetical protein
MKSSTQILLLLALLSLTLSQETSTVTESTVTTESVTTEEAVVTEEAVSVTEEAVTPGADAFNACDPNNRPEVCTLQYAPVCGYIHNCEGGACTSTFGNDCSACADSTVDGWVDGACEDVRTTCDPNNQPEACPLIFTATCAVAGNCQGPHCFQDTSNSCVACSLEGVAYSLPGACPESDQGLRQNCDDNNRPNICTADWTPVCAHLANCVRNSCWSTAGNACSACADVNIDFYVPGECPEIVGVNEEGNAENAENGENGNNEEDEGLITECDIGNRPEVCSADFNPVCAHITGCQIGSGDCTRTASNGCDACSQGDVDFYFQGVCPW